MIGQWEPGLAQEAHEGLQLYSLIDAVEVLDSHASSQQCAFTDVEIALLSDWWYKVRARESFGDWERVDRKDDGSDPLYRRWGPPNRHGHRCCRASVQRDPNPNADPRRPWVWMVFSAEGSLLKNELCSDMGNAMGFADAFLRQYTQDQLAGGADYQRQLEQDIEAKREELDAAAKRLGDLLDG